MAGAPNRAAGGPSPLFRCFGSFLLTENLEAVAPAPLPISQGPSFCDSTTPCVKSAVRLFSLGITSLLFFLLCAQIPASFSSPLHYEWPFPNVLELGTAPLFSKRWSFFSTFAMCRRLFRISPSDSLFFVTIQVLFFPNVWRKVLSPLCAYLNRRMAPPPVSGKMFFSFFSLPRKIEAVPLCHFSRRRSRPPISRTVDREKSPPTPSSFPT